MLLELHIVASSDQRAETEAVCMRSLSKIRTVKQGCEDVVESKKTTVSKSDWVTSISVVMLI
jgi:hypothetical protein